MKKLTVYQHCIDAFDRCKAVVIIVDSKGEEVGRRTIAYDMQPLSKIADENRDNAVYTLKTTFKPDSIRYLCNIRGEYRYMRQDDGSYQSAFIRPPWIPATKERKNIRWTPEPDYVDEIARLQQQIKELEQEKGLLIWT